MNKILISLFATTTLLSISQLVLAESKCDVIPYLGFDTEWRHLNFQRGFGDNLFKHNYPQGNIYAGIKVNEYIGVELGYEATERKTRTNTLNAGDVSAGVTVPSGVNLQYNSTAQVKGPHANLLGFLPMSICDIYQFHLIAMVGIVHLETNFLRNNISANGTPFNLNSNFTRHKNLLRLGVGIQHMVAKNWGIRGMLKWENTKRLNSYDPLHTISFIANKNSLIYSFGAFVNF